MVKQGRFKTKVKVRPGRLQLASLLKAVNYLDYIACAPHMMLHTVNYFNSSPGNSGLSAMHRTRILRVTVIYTSN